MNANKNLVCPICKLIRKRFRHLIWLEPSSTEIISIFAAIGWALSFYIVQNTIMNPAYSRLLLIGSTEIWAGLLLIMATVQSLALLHDERLWRAYSCLLAGSIWFLIAGLVWSVQPFTPSAWVYATIAIACCWASAQNDYRRRRKTDV